MAKTYTPIATVTVGPLVSSYTFSNLPNTYTDIVILTAYANTTTANGLGIRFNGDSANNYSFSYMGTNGSTGVFGRFANQSFSYIAYYGVTDSTTIGSPAILETHVMSYANTNINKSFIGTNGGVLPGNGPETVTGTWRSTSAINSITILAAPSGNLATGSTITLFGVKSA